jgi:hypothetical protein
MTHRMFAAGSTAVNRSQAAIAAFHCGRYVVIFFAGCTNMAVIRMKYLSNITVTTALLLALGTGPVAADPDRLQATTRYDTEYPVIAYSGPAHDNRVWRLQQGLKSGQLKLEWEPRFGYLRALLKALQIDVDSQVLVFSRTSLQIEHISPLTPRAIYFNDDTYVGYVQGSPLIELVTIDNSKGSVFYGLENRTEFGPQIEREGGRCLTCHDTFSMGGGGVPRVMVLSSPVDDPSEQRDITAGTDVDDRTPFGNRWGGWYVTGDTGRRTHLGNLPLTDGRGGQRLGEQRASSQNRQQLDDYFDTSKYLSGQSDVVALTVLEHQTSLHNLVTRVAYKVRTVLSRSAGASTSGPLRAWEDLSPNDHQQLRQMIEPLVRALFLKDAAPFEDRMRGSSGFAERFSQLGPRDSKGRGLRELDLQKRLFRYPLSFEIYSDHFDAMPKYALDYVFGRIAEILRGKDTTGLSASLSAADRKAIAEILIDTKPALAPLLLATQPALSAR